MMKEEIRTEINSEIKDMVKKKNKKKNLPTIPKLALNFKLQTEFICVLFSPSSF